MAAIVRGCVKVFSNLSLLTFRNSGYFYLHFLWAPFCTITFTCFFNCTRKWSTNRFALLQRFRTPRILLTWSSIIISSCLSIIGIVSSIIRIVSLTIRIFPLIIRIVPTIIRIVPAIIRIVPPIIRIIRHSTIISWLWFSSVAFSISAILPSISRQSRHQFLIFSITLGIILTICTIIINVLFNGF